MQFFRIATAVTCLMTSISSPVWAERLTIDRATLYQKYASAFGMSAACGVDTSKDYANLQRSARAEMNDQYYDRLILKAYASAQARSKKLKEANPSAFKRDYCGTLPSYWQRGTAFAAR